MKLWPDLAFGGNSPVQESFKHSIMVCRMRRDWVAEMKREREKRNGWSIRSCQHRWDQRLGLRAWRRWSRSCSPGRNSECPWSAFYQQCSSSSSLAHSLTLLCSSLFSSVLCSFLCNSLLPTPIQFKQFISCFWASLTLLFCNFFLYLSFFFRYFIFPSSF